FHLCGLPSYEQSSARPSSVPSCAHPSSASPSAHPCASPSERRPSWRASARPCVSPCVRPSSSHQSVETLSCEQVPSCPPCPMIRPCCVDCDLLMGRAGVPRTRRKWHTFLSER